MDAPDHRKDCETRARNAGYDLNRPSPGSMTSSDRVHTLRDYVRSLASFVLVDEIPESYDHMGAIITDAILQSGLNYDSVVRPRVQRLRREYPECRTTSGFLDALEKQGPATIIQWTHHEKSGRILGLARFLQTECIETEAQFATWLQKPASPARLKQLRGIGDKTADYLRILVGLQASAVDRHLLAFLKEARIDVRGYADAQQVINATADLLGVDHTQFDSSIWTCMSTKTRAEAVSVVPEEVARTEHTDNVQHDPSSVRLPGLVRATKEAGQVLQAHYGNAPIPVLAIRQEAARRGSYPENSILPSDYCYNLVNKNPTSFQFPMFVRVTRGMYKYLGLDYPFTGPIYAKPHGGVERQVGEWRDGIYTLCEDPRTQQSRFEAVQP